MTDGVLLDIEATPFSGLLLVPVTLPNNLTMLAIIDTGADDNADFGFYEDALSGIDFHITYVSQTNDATGQLRPLLYGNIGPITLGSLTFQNPIISRRVKSTENPYGTRLRPGFLTCRFFESYITQIDFKSNRLRLLKRKREN
jgi:hypothetical protein